MAYTRAFIRNAAKESGVEIPKELEDVLINEHIAARDAYTEEKVNKTLEENKPAKPVKVTDSEEYKTLKKQFDDYKADVEGKAAQAAKETAVKAYLESKNITGDNLRLAMRSIQSEIKAAEMDGEKLKDTKTFDDLLAGDLKGLITTTTEKGANPPANPPANVGGTMTKDQIMGIKDRAERRAAIAANMSLFETKGD
jgi:hypothetical protein